MNLYTIPCILFSGGKSSRMGEDKSRLPFGGKPTLIEYQHDRLEAFFERVYISAKPNTHYDFDPLVIEDDIDFPEVAPTSGLLTAFKRLKAENTIFILSVDTPFVNKEVFKAFNSVNIGDYDAVIARTPGGIHPLCGVYTRSLEAPLLAMYRQGEHKLGKLLHDSNVLYIDIEDDDLLMNLNTPNEYKTALEYVKQI